MATDLTLAIDRARCVGSGMCALTAPDLFDQDDEDGLVRLRTAEPPPTHTAAAHQAAALCPAAALTVTQPRG